jgi:hypothetical protein
MRSLARLTGGRMRAGDSFAAAYGPKLEGSGAAQ